MIECGVKKELLVSLTLKPSSCSVSNSCMQKNLTELFFCLGRIDRKIEFPLPDEKTKKRIFQIHTSRMTLADDVTLDELIMAKDDLSGADIKVSVHHHCLYLKTQLESHFCCVQNHCLLKLFSNYL